jgi:hypothetical protein
MDRTLVAGCISFAAICFFLSLSGFWALSNLKTMPDAELMLMQVRPLDVIAESQAAFNYWGSIALLILGSLSLVVAGVYVRVT